jgi:hypothetical protein
MPKLIQPFEGEAEKLRIQYTRDREQYEKDHPDAKKRRKNPSGAEKTLPSPAASPAVETQAGPSTTADKKGKDKSPKAERKTTQKEKDKGKGKEKEKEKEKEKDKEEKREKRKRRSDAK